MKFFAIWFLSELLLAPTSMSALGAAGPVCISLASITSQKLSKRCTESLPVQVSVTGLLQQVVAAALPSAREPASLAAALRFCCGTLLYTRHTPKPALMGPAGWDECSSALSLAFWTLGCFWPWRCSQPQHALSHGPQ